MLDELDAHVRGPRAELMRRIERAISAGVKASSLPLNELTFAVMFGKSGGESYFENCVRVLRRWLRV